jgi:hypothetical protein
MLQKWATKTNSSYSACIPASKLDCISKTRVLDDEDLNEEDLLLLMACNESANAENACFFCEK